MTRSVVALVACIALAASPALAKNDKGQGKGGGGGQGNAHAEKSQGGGGQGKSKGNQGGGSQAKSKGGGGQGPAQADRSYGGGYDGDHGGSGSVVRFSTDDRDLWRDYWHDEYERGHCPPGLAKKHNGCMPPGQAKKRYRVGYPLPPDVIVVPVPVVLLPRLAPCPPGYRYGMVDGDLVKLAVGTLLVVDAIDGLVNGGGY
jgi:hypothetical protein